MTYRKYMQTIFKKIKSQYPDLPPPQLHHPAYNLIYWKGFSGGINARYYLLATDSSIKPKKTIWTGVCYPPSLSKRVVVASTLRDITLSDSESQAASDTTLTLMKRRLTMWLQQFLGKIRRMLGIT